MHQGKSLRVALVGFGVMGRNHLACMRRLPHSRLVAIAEPRQDQRHGVEPTVPWFSDAAAMLDAVRPDVVHIVTPPASHYTLASLCLARGTHVYVEKPFVATMAEAIDLVELARRNNLKLCAGHQMVFQNASLRAEAGLAGIGRIIDVESYFSFNPWTRAMPKAELLLDVLPHPVYSALRFVPVRERAIRVEHVDTDPNGEARIALRCGDVRVRIAASMNGRPPDHFVRITGSDGTMVVDYVRSILVAHPGSPDVISALMQPFRTARQLTMGAVSSFAGFAAGGEARLPGLAPLIRRFHEAVLNDGASPVAPADILDTVRVCEEVTRSITHRRMAIDSAAVGASRGPAASRDETVVVTGGTGFIGRVVTDTLAREGWRVRVVGRRVPPVSDRLPGVEYRAADLGERVPPDVFDGVSWVVHCAAATSGGLQEHNRNSVAGTRHVHDGCVAAGVRGLVYMSSLGVMRAAPWYTTRPITESSAIETVHDGRGQYVRGKTAAEHELRRLVAASGLPCRILRPGAVIDPARFEPPGCLGRELAGRFFTVGRGSSPVATCDVHMLAAIVARYVDDFDAMPSALNVIDPDQPTRGDLIARLQRQRPGLRVTRIPAVVVLLLTWFCSAAQKILSPAKRPLNLRSAFYLDHYDASLTRNLLARAKPVKRQTTLAGSVGAS